MHPKVLFILKKRDVKWGGADGYSYCGGFSSGLYNSARLVHEMLIKNDIESKLVEVIDANFIDKEVFHYRPTHVIIEACWVIPSKFSELVKLHPSVKWIVRNHSEVPFLSTEGCAFGWLLDYAAYENVFISNNSENIDEDFVKLISFTYDIPYEAARRKVVYLPNYYHPGAGIKDLDKCKSVVDIGCFSACRILKNQAIQAIAAIQFSRLIKKELNFHMNATRIEGGGEPVLKTIRAIFERVPNCNLIEHDWRSHAEFLELIKSIDIGMQVSYTETFNIVASDFVSEGVPIVASPEVKWLHSLSHANPNSTVDIINKLVYAYENPARTTSFNKSNLKSYSFNSEKVWLKYLRN